MIELTDNSTKELIILNPNYIVFFERAHISENPTGGTRIYLRGREQSDAYLVVEGYTTIYDKLRHAGYIGEPVQVGECYYQGVPQCSKKQ